MFKSTVLGALLISVSAFASASNNAITEDQYNYKVNDGLFALNSKNYKDALPKLTEAAKLGSKEAQFYLAQMYLNGWGTEADYQEGWLWLNVALEQRTTDWREAFTKIKRALPEDFINAMQPYVDKHIQEFGAESQNLDCRRKRQTGSNITNIICTKRFIM